MKYRFWIYFFITFAVSLLFNVSIAQAAPVYDHTNGIYTDDFANGTGVGTSSYAGVNTTTGVIQLKNLSNEYTAPYVQTGYVITKTLIPNSVVKWGTITYTANIPENTSIRLQILDEFYYVYSDTLLSGNESGFTSDSVDISDLSVLRFASGCGSNTKFPRIRLKFYLETGDSNITPTITNLQFTWTVKQGDFTASPLADSAWPGYDHDNQSTWFTTQQVTSYLTPGWVQNIGNHGGAKTYISSDNKLIVKTGGGMNQERTCTTDALISIFNKDTGISQHDEYSGGFAGSMGYVTQNNTLFMSDIYNDIMYAYDLNNRQLKWTFQYTDYGHGLDYVRITPDGSTLYTVRQRLNDKGYRLLAFNTDGTLKWQKINDDNLYARHHLLGRNGNYYITSSTSYSSSAPGKIYSLSPTDGSPVWTYDTQEGASVAALGQDDTIYVATVGSYYIDTPTELFIYAVNSDGTLKWKSSLGILTKRISRLLIRSDGNIICLLTNSFYDPGPVVNYTAYNQSGLVVLDQDDGSIIQSISQDHLYLDLLGVANNNLITTLQKRDNSGTLISSKIEYLNSNFQSKFKYYIEGLNNLYISSVDNQGHIYGNLSGPSYLDGTSLFSFKPWTLSVSTDLVYPHLHPNDSITFTVTSSMKQIDPFVGGNNQVQVVLSNGDNLALDYFSTDLNGNSLWTGTYTLPSDMSTGLQTYTVEASQSHTQTDITTHFASPSLNSNNTGIATTGSFSVELSQATIDNPDVSLTDSTATISWITDYSSTTQLSYGLTSSLGTTTPLTDVDPLVTYHTVSLSSLISCTLYYYQPISIDIASNQTLGTINSFITDGCGGVGVDSSVSHYVLSQITHSIGGSLTLASTMSGLHLNLPPHVKQGLGDSDSIDLQAKVVDSTPIISSKGVPPVSITSDSNTNPNQLISSIFDIKAYTGVGDTISDFSEPVTVSITYTDSQVNNFDGSTLSIYRHDGTSWHLLDTTIDYPNHLLTATTTSFSLFGIFAKPYNNPILGVTTNGPPTCGDPMPVSIPDLFQINTTSTTAKLFFTPITNTSDFYISFSTNPQAQEHGELVSLIRQGVQSHTVYHLSPNTTYYFKVRGNIGCQPGDWSTILKVKTKPTYSNSTPTPYYKYKSTLGKLTLNKNTTSM